MVAVGLRVALASVGGDGIAVAEPRVAGSHRAGASGAAGRSVREAAAVAARATVRDAPEVGFAPVGGIAVAVVQTALAIEAARPRGARDLGARRRGADVVARAAIVDVAVDEGLAPVAEHTVTIREAEAADDHLADAERAILQVGRVAADAATAAVVVVEAGVEAAIAARHRRRGALGYAARAAGTAGRRRSRAGGGAIATGGGGEEIRLAAVRGVGVTVVARSVALRYPAGAGRALGGRVVDGASGAAGATVRRGGRRRLAARALGPVAVVPPGVAGCEGAPSSAARGVGVVRDAGGIASAAVPRIARRIDAARSARRAPGRAGGDAGGRGAGDVAARRRRVAGIAARAAVRPGAEGRLAAVADHPVAVAPAVVARHDLAHAASTGLGGVVEGAESVLSRHAASTAIGAGEDRGLASVARIAVAVEEVVVACRDLAGAAHTARGGVGRPAGQVTAAAVIEGGRQVHLALVLGVQVAVPPPRRAFRPHTAIGLGADARVAGGQAAGRGRWLGLQEDLDDAVRVGEVDGFTAGDDHPAGGVPAGDPKSIGSRVQVGRLRGPPRPSRWKLNRVELLGGGAAAELDRRLEGDHVRSERRVGEAHVPLELLGAIAPEEAEEGRQQRPTLGP